MEQWEPSELRGSRWDLRAAEGAVPSADSPVVARYQHSNRATMRERRCISTKQTFELLKFDGHILAAPLTGRSKGPVVCPTLGDLLLTD